jgi:Helicase conserved C-terminal domain
VNYAELLEVKAQLECRQGFKPTFLPDFLFDFQKAMVERAVRYGRYALFEDCGLGKTAQELVWAQNGVEHTNRPFIIFCPLAVAYQHKREADKFGIEAEVSRDGKFAGKIVITNYEQIDKFNPSDFAGAVCDESSILKSFNAATRKKITIFMRKLSYRLLATATAAPNDYTELGTSSEALGYLGYTDMLNRFFKNDLNNSATGRMRGEVIKWRFKGHAEKPFWKWVCSWSRAIRKPSDIGFDDKQFLLPPLIERQHCVGVNTLPPGYLFALPAAGLKEQREEGRRSIRERCEQVAQLVATKEQALVWCHMNDEGDLLEELIPNAVQVAGGDSDEVKEERLLAFASGQARVLVTKSKIAGWGLNFQNCHHVTFFPSHSFEQYYQGVRRCWRFGQKSPVTVDIVTTEGQTRVLKNLQRKAIAADKMFSSLVAEMNNALAISKEDKFKHKERIPSWL